MMIQAIDTVFSHRLAIKQSMYRCPSLSPEFESYFRWISNRELGVSVPFARWPLPFVGSFVHELYRVFEFCFPLCGWKWTIFFIEPQGLQFQYKSLSELVFIHQFFPGTIQYTPTTSKHEQVSCFGHIVCCVYRCRVASLLEAVIPCTSLSNSVSSCLHNQSCLPDTGSCLREGKQRTTSL